MQTRIPLALAGALIAGVAMSWGQTYAPDVLAPLFNSAAPVVALSAAVAWAGRGTVSTIALGAAAGPLAMVGYYVTAQVRGYGMSAGLVFWSMAGIVIGSLVGVAIVLMRRRLHPLATAAAVAWMPGLALGEATHGLTRIADTTPVAYWWAQALLAVGVLVWLAITRLTTLVARLASLAAAVLAGAALWVAYGVL